MDNSKESKGLDSKLYEADVSILDIWELLMRRKKEIISVISLVMLGVGVYLYKTKPIYQAEAYITPIGMKSIRTLEAINKDITGIAKDKDEDNILGLRLYSSFIRLLHSPEIKKLYAKQNDFHGKLDISVEGDNRRMTMKAPDPKLAEKWLNGIIRLADTETIKEATKYAEDKLELRKKEISSLVQKEKNTGLSSKKFQLLKLSKDYKVAKALGIKKFKAPVEHWKGTDAIHAEINVTKELSEDDFITLKILTLRDELKNLNAFNLNMDGISALTIKHKASAGDKPVRPRIKLVLILGFLLAAILAIVFAFLVDYVSKLRAGYKAKLNNLRL